MNNYEAMSDEELRKLYVPDVYQPDIYKIDYRQLKKAGILLISFGVDDTIVKAGEIMLPKKTIRLFRELKESGFKLVLLSNNKSRRRADIFSSELGVDYIADARKPGKSGFTGCRQLYYLPYRKEPDVRQMAHIGSSLINDIAGGNAFGTTTCLVESLTESVHFPDETHNLTEILKGRNIWINQYYQL